MACPMALIKRENTSLSTETRIKSDLINLITRIRTGVRIKKGITRANTGIRTRIGIDIVPVPLRTKKSMIVAVARIKTKTRRALPARIRSTRAAHPVRTKIKTRVRTRSIITSHRAPVLKIKRGKANKNLINKCLIQIFMKMIFTDIIAALKTRIRRAKIKISTDTAVL